jgi:rSAM/selenodomain-associated transferase 2
LPPFAAEGFSLPASFAVVIPTLNAAASLVECLQVLGQWPGQAPLSVVIADGGSNDGTNDLSHPPGVAVQWLNAPTGRGMQLAAGAALALENGAEWLLFLHADTLLPARWPHLISKHIATAPQHVGYFDLSFSVPPGQRRAARRVATLANGRARWLGLPYGDQGLLISATLYQALGGYGALPLMEDVDLIRRLKRHAGRSVLRPLGAAVQTSAERYQQAGWWRRSGKNVACLFAYWLGLPIEKIARWYRR